MKHDCEVVRDLMPMYLDGTASEKSRAAVDEHVAECAPCRGVLEEMRQEVSAAPPKEQAGKLVKKLRHRRRLRTALLVLLGMVLCLVLAFFAWRGWDYYFDDFSVVTPMNNYSVEAVPHGYNGVQLILTMKNGRAQWLNHYFDEETGDLYVWSTTTRLPRSAGSMWTISMPGSYYYRQDCGFAAVTDEYDENGRKAGWNVSVMSHIYKGAPVGRYWNADEPELLYTAEPVDEKLLREWFEEIEAYHVRTYSRDTGMDWLLRQERVTETNP